jgi:hypothetical protein
MEYTALDMSHIALINETSRKDATQGPTSDYLRLPDKPSFALALRILPAKKGPPYYLYGAHKLRNRTYICRRRALSTRDKLLWLAPTGEQDCPVCAYWKYRWSKIPRGQQPAPAERNTLSDIKVMHRCSWNVVARELDGHRNVGPLIWSCGLTLAQKIWASIVGDPAPGIKGKGDICNPQTGRDFLLRKKPKGGSSFPDYSDSEILEPSPAGTPEEWKRWMDSLHDLTVTIQDHETLAHALAVHLGTEKDEGEAGDFSRFEPKPQSGASANGPASVPIAVQVPTKAPKPDPKAPAVDEDLADPEFLAELEALKPER